MTPAKEIALKHLAQNLGFPDSENLRKLLDFLLTEQEAEWISQLPGTPKALAEKFQVDEEEMQTNLHDLFMRGIILVTEHENGQPVYIFDHKPGRFMDTILFDPRYREEMDEEFFDIWKAFYNDELVETHTDRPAKELPFRVITVMEEIEGQQGFLPYEHAEEVLVKAERIAIQACPCRTRERNCDAPLETCISLNKVADYMLARGIAREVEVDEALSVLRHSEEIGLVHETDNNVDPTVICNCCPCCCTFLRAITKYGQDAVVARSRYRAFIDPTMCQKCDSCIERCYFDAIEAAPESNVVDQQICYGCGLCVSACPESAISMFLFEDGEYIPTERETFFHNVDELP